MVSVSTVCGNCGHGQITGVCGEPSDIVSYISHDAYKNYGILTFSDWSARQKGGSRLAQYIRDMKLGELQESPEVQNVLYEKGHKIRVWTWMIDRKAVKAFVARGCMPEAPKPVEAPKADVPVVDAVAAVPVSAVAKPKAPRKPVIKPKVRVIDDSPF